MTTTEKEKACLICCNDFIAERSTKKYCSDNCKQIAFYQRNGAKSLPLNHNEKQHQSEVHNEIPDTLTSEMIKQKEESIVLSTYNRLKSETNTEIYCPVHSVFIEAVAEAIEAEEQHMSIMMYQIDRWNAATKEAITIINTRLLSLIANLLLLCCHNAIDRKTFLLIRNAFNAMILSPSFKLLPTEYCYSTLIHELTSKCNSITKMHKHNPTFRLRFSVKRKVQLMAIRFKLALTVTAKNFYDIQFEK